MVNRFLGWRLPEDFHPDGGIVFTSSYDNGTKQGGRHEPEGTNLFNAEQAEAMIQFMLEDLPEEPKESSVELVWAIAGMFLAAGILGFMMIAAVSGLHGWITEPEPLEFDEFIERVDECHARKMSTQWHESGDGRYNNVICKGNE